MLLIFINRFQQIDKKEYLEVIGWYENLDELF